MTLFGQYGDSGERPLSKSETHTDKFERGKVGYSHILVYMINNMSISSTLKSSVLQLFEFRLKLGYLQN